MNPLIFLLASSAAVALVAYVYCMVLTEAGMILNPWYNFLDRHLGWQSGEQPRALWLFNPMIGCFKCVAGQAALWFFLIKRVETYDLFEHIFYICFAIFASQAFHKFYTYTKQ